MNRLYSFMMIYIFIFSPITVMGQHFTLGAGPAQIMGQHVLPRLYGCRRLCAYVLFSSYACGSVAKL